MALIGSMEITDKENGAVSASRAAFDAESKVNDWKLVLAQDKLVAENRKAVTAGIVHREGAATTADARKADLDDNLAADKTYQAALLKIAETENEIAGFEASASSWRREYSIGLYMVRSRTAMLNFLGAGDAMIDESKNNEGE